MGRPRVVLNCAASADGKLALPDGSPLEISSEEDMLRVHRLRAECGTVLVGVGTVISDDPKLHVSPARVPDPPPLTKVVLDASGRTPTDARFLTTPGRAVVGTTERSAQRLGERLGEDVLVLPCGDGVLVDLHVLLDRLGAMGVEAVLVEGGGTTLWSFLSSGLVDELSVYTGPVVVGGATSPTMADGDGAAGRDGVVDVELLSAERLGDGLWTRYALRRHR